jgi:hypothetical protein
LSRVRLALRLPAVDDDYGEEKTIVARFLGSPAHSTIDTVYGDMKRHYHAATAFAKKQNSRLDTEWYSGVVSRRII